LPYSNVLTIFGVYNPAIWSLVRDLIRAAIQAQYVSKRVNVETLLDNNCVKCANHLINNNCFITCIT